MLRMSADHHLRMVAHCISGLPEEACGLLAGVPGTADVEACYLTTNAARSARVYEVDPREHLRADRDAERLGLEIIGVFHSHTHTDAYPSPTDIAQAPDPAWHYVIVSLRDSRPVVRSYLIVDGLVLEESVVVTPFHGLVEDEPGDQADDPADADGEVAGEAADADAGAPSVPKHARKAPEVVERQDPLAS